MEHTIFFRGRRRLALLLLAPLLGGVPSAQAVEDGEAAFQSFEGVASADGVRATFTALNTTAVEELVDLGAPVAQASLDSLGNSLALAAAPFPGSVANENAGLVASLAGLPPPPDNPAVAQSDPSNPEVTVVQPGYELSAESTSGSAQGRAALGQSDDTASVLSSTALARVELADDNRTLRANGESVIAAFHVPDVITIAGVRAEASASRSAGSDDVSRSQSLSIDVLNIAGMPVGLSDAGLVVVGQVVPVPIEPVLEGLAEQGVTIRVLDPVEFEDGILSAALEVTVEMALPDPSLPSGKLQFVLGRSMARVGARSAVVRPVTSVESSFETPDPAPSAPVPSGAEPALGPDALSGSVSQPVVSGPAPTSSPAPSSSAGAAVQPGPTDATLTSPVVSLASPSTLASMYLIIILGAALGGGALQLVRKMGVQLTWN